MCISDMPDMKAERENACFHYLNEVGCFAWTLVVKVDLCSCFFHPHFPQEIDGAIECGSYEVQAEATTFTGMANLAQVHLYFHTKDPNENKRAQDILQSGRVLLIHCSTWCLEERVTLYIDNLEQMSRLPQEHEQVMAALMDDIKNREDKNTQDDV